MTKLWLDLETYSPVPITNGTHRYAAGAEILLLAWAIDDGPVSVWDCTLDALPPAPLRNTMFTELWAHNSGFDRTVLRAAMPSLLPTDPRHWRDTMVQAYAHGLPGSLASLCEILRVPTDRAKDKEGKRLVRLFCIPPAKNIKRDRATRDTHPEDWAYFMEYARLDIEAMREVHKRLPVWNYQGAELALWHLDQTINDRGVRIDMDLVHAAIDTVEAAKVELAARTMEITDGEVSSTTRRDVLLTHVLEEYGVGLPDTQIATLERRMADPDINPALKELLAIRLQASSTSTAKFATLLKGTSSDGRLRGTLQFDGAPRTRRWAGRLFQPQNLPRPTLKNDDIDVGIDAMVHGAAAMLYSNVMELASSALRGTIISPKGKKLVVADLSNIEGRDQAWLAGEQWKLQAFRDFDAGTGHDLYKMAYGKSFGVAPQDVTKDQRQVGKVQELALGYAGGVGAFVTFASAYSIDLEDLATKVLPLAPAAILNESERFFEWSERENRQTFGLSREAFVACETLKRGWRLAHPAISSLWAELEAAAAMAVDRPGNTIACRCFRLRRDGAWLRIALPSGNVLCYPGPQIDDGVLTFMGMNQYTRKWSRLTTYGGKIFENACQSLARDVMAHNMPLIEAAGYQIVLTVHDEVICEAPDSPEFNADHLASLLANNPPWAPDMPLAAAGFETYRYRKD